MSVLLNDPVLLLAAAGVGLTLLLLLLAFGDGDRKKKARRVDRLRARAAGEPAEPPRLRREASDRRRIDQAMRRFIPQPDLLRQRLHRTGRQIGLGTYGLVCLAVALCAGVIVVAAGQSPVLAVPVGLLSGLWLPYLGVGWAARRRAHRFTMLFPEAIGLMVRGVKSGLPITETYKIVGQEISDPVGKEFREISDQIRIGQPIDRALFEAARRIDTPEIKFLVVTLAVQRETGGNLAETLENLDSILRRRRQMRLKIRAMSSEARASAMIIGGLPFVMMGLLSLVSPDYMAALFTTSRGQHMLWSGGVSMAIGVLIMAKMVRFEI